MNEDGSVDIYLGETAPKGFESNWIPTAGEDFFLLFRLYGPEESFSTRASSFQTLSGSIERFRLTKGPAS
jgi:hypothetical protein